MQTSFLGISQVANLLGIRKHRLEYAITSGQIPEPIRFLGKRAFCPSDVRLIAAYFGTKNQLCETGGESCSGSSL